MSRRSSASALPKPRPPTQFEFRLYVSGVTPASARAVVNTRKFCEQHLHGRYRLEILNIAEHVAQASRDQVVAAPTLLKMSPLPPRRFIGDMSDTPRMLAGLGEPPAA